MPFYAVTVLTDEQRQDFADWLADGNVYTDERSSTPEEPCECCRATWPHRRIRVYDKSGGDRRAAGFMCESDVPLPNSPLN